MKVSAWTVPVVPGHDPRVERERRRELRRQGGLKVQRLVREGKIEPMPVCNFTPEQRKVYGRMGADKARQMRADGTYKRRLNPANIRRLASLASVGGKARWAKANKEKETARLREMARLGGAKAKANAEERRGKQRQGGTVAS